MSEPSHPPFSVIMPNYNQAEYIPEALDAILNQSLQPHEIIVIDDGSKDGSVSIIKQYAERHPVMKFLKNPENRGVVYSINLGMESATCPYLHFAAFDDRVLPGFYEKSMEHLAQYPQAGFCSTQSVAIDKDGHIISHTPVISKTPRYFSPYEMQKILYKYEGWIWGNTLIYRQKALEEMGGFNPELGSFSDGFLCRAIALKYGVCFIPEPLAAVRLHSGSYSYQTMIDLDKSYRIRDEATHLMQTTYRDLFSDRYVAAWARTMDMTLESRLTQHHRAQIQKLWHAVQSPSILQRLCFRGVQAAITFSYMLFHFLFFIRLNRERRWFLIWKKLKRVIGKSRIA